MYILAKTPEGIIEDYAMKVAQSKGFMFEKWTSGSTGVPDRIIVGHKKVVFMELKQLSGRLSERQKLVITLLRKHDAIVYIPYSKEDIDTIFEELSTCSMTAIRKLHKDDKIK